MLHRWIVLALAVVAVAAPAVRADDAAAREQIARGRYMVLVGHCSNCHTAGYMASAGNVARAGVVDGQSARLAQQGRHDLRQQSAHLLFSRQRQGGVGSEKSWATSAEDRSMGADCVTNPSAAASSVYCAAVAPCASKTSGKVVE